MDDATATLKSLISAFNARDHASYEALLSDDLVAFAGVVTPLRFDGKQAWMGFVRSLDRFASATQEQRHSASRAYNDDTVVCQGYFVFTTVSKDGAADTQTGRESYTLAMTDGAWRVAALHFSAMF